MDGILILLILSAVALIWWDNRSAAEIAIQAAKRSCQQAGVVFLNDTVAWHKVRLKRNRHGRLQLQRTYFFEFSSDIAVRYRGEIIMLGRQINYVSLDAYRV